MCSLMPRLKLNHPFKRFNLKHVIANHQWFTYFDITIAELITQSVHLFPKCRPNFITRRYLYIVTPVCGARSILKKWYPFRMNNFISFKLWSKICLDDDKIMSSIPTKRIVRPRELQIQRSYI